MAIGVAELLIRTNTPLTESDADVEVCIVVGISVCICAAGEFHDAVGAAPPSYVTVVRNPWSLKEVLTSYPEYDEPTGKAEEEGVY